MVKRHVMVYYAWSRPGENGAPLHIIDDRFPALFESRRMGFPRFHEFADPRQFDQSIAGFLDHIMKRNFTAFVDLAAELTGESVTEIERVADDGMLTPLDAHLLNEVDTLIVISFDSLRTVQTAGNAEIEALRSFLEEPDHLARTTISAKSRTYRKRSGYNGRLQSSNITATGQFRRGNGSAASRARSLQASACRWTTALDSDPRQMQTDRRHRLKANRH
jgi:hypothetical protein